MGKGFDHLRKEIETLEASKGAIVTEWMAHPVVRETLHRHGFTTDFFAKYFGVKVVEFLFGVVTGVNRAGTCPVIAVMLIMFKEKKIPLQDIFMICVQLKNSLLKYAYRRQILGPEILEEIVALTDRNFVGVIEDYMELYHTVPAASGASVLEKIRRPVGGEESASREPERVAETVRPERKVAEPPAADARRNRVTSALEYADEVEVDMEMIDELIELEYEALEHLDLNEELNAAVKEGVVNLFVQYSRILNMMIEFKELAYTLNMLKDLLAQTDPESLDSVNKRAIPTYIRAIINDLNHWRTTVFIERSAEDIHYLDKTLLSSIAQLEIMLLPPEEEAEDGIEFF